MITAPTSATRTMTSEPGTQSACTVEPEIASVSSRTPVAETAVLQLGFSVARRGRRPDSRLVEADCIPCPQEAAEVVALAHHVEVDVGAEIEGERLVGAPEGGGVEVEGEHGGAAAPDRLQRAHPGGLGTGRDDGDRAPRQAPDL